MSDSKWTLDDESMLLKKLRECTDGNVVDIRKGLERALALVQLVNNHPNTRLFDVQINPSAMPRREQPFGVHLKLDVWVYAHAVDIPVQPHELEAGGK